MLTNQVNTIANLHGINIIAANGSVDMNRPGAITSRDHLFTPAVHGNELPEVVTKKIGVSLCNIRQESDRMILDIKFDVTTCPEEPPTGPVFGAAGQIDSTPSSFNDIISAILRGPK